ncbi:DUF4148 domain-containing protein [Caballeronia sp. GACF4]|uniref:DUF4148 domain-containing protein n=1 Tax=Caballeronia sp. GACF4 TaxID=2921763 RepID=UPI00202898C3|nr:DUF4148 domain-containing protein [Caballeronia sp. GACF4]
MKPFFSAIAIAAAFAVPALSYAQTDAPLTRAQVRAELAQLENAGYNPVAADPTYPSNIQAAEARVSTQSVAQASARSNDYGSVTAGSSQAGRTASTQPRAFGTFFGQ